MSEINNSIYIYTKCRVFSRKTVQRKKGKKKEKKSSIKSNFKYFPTPQHQRKRSLRTFSLSYCVNHQENVTYHICIFNITWVEHSMNRTQLQECVSEFHSNRLVQRTLKENMVFIFDVCWTFTACSRFPRSYW